MNYIELINNFWTLADQNPFTAAATQIYFFLLNKSNRSHWRNPLKESDRFIAASLQMSVNTVRRAKNELQYRGLITFKAGNPKGGRSLKSQTEYRLKNVSENYTQTDTNEINISGNASENYTQTDTIYRKNVSENYTQTDTNSKHKTSNKTKDKNIVDFSFFNFSDFCNYAERELGIYDKYGGLGSCDFEHFMIEDLDDGKPRYKRKLDLNAEFDEWQSTRKNKK